MARIINTGNGKCTIKDLCIWTEGVFRGYGSPPEGDKYTKKDLQGMVKAAKEMPHLRPRIYHGHPLNPQLSMLAKPKGDLDNFRTAGGKLIVDVHNVPLHIAKQAVKDDVRFSPDMRMNYLDAATGKTHKWAITGVAMLGAVSPGNILIPSLGDQVTDDSHYIEEVNRSFAAHNQRSFVLDMRMDTDYPMLNPMIARFVRSFAGDNERRVIAPRDDFQSRLLKGIRDL